MFLKTMEIFGFKSFPERVRIEFPRGISALIGPNGCGKSNVVDSIKWVLGEQSTRTLRASRMEDVIFNGTETRKPLNVAEVELTIVNENGLLPLDVAEISVKRRLFRTGESEYYINTKMVRLKELKELFYDTGVGKSAYSIMEQGKIDQILSNKPEERRYIFEEAAGITKYKMRGMEADRKLQKTEENIQQAQTILAEVKRSYETLKVQAQKTESYRNLNEKIFDLEVKTRLLKLRELYEDKGKLEKELENESKNRMTFQKDIDGLNELMEKNIDIVNTMESRLVENQKSLYGIDIEKNNKESQIRIIKERIGELERKIESDKAREKVCHEKIAMFKEDYEKKTASLTDLDNHIKEIEQNIINFKKDITHFSEKIKNNDQEIINGENAIVVCDKEIENFTTELRKITDDIVTQLDEKLHETEYSMQERQKIEKNIDDLLGTIKIQISGKSAMLSDMSKLTEIKKAEMVKVVDSTISLVEEVSTKVEQLLSLFSQYKLSTPSFIDEFLAPEGIITKKREIDQELLARQEQISTIKSRIKAINAENKSLSTKIEEYRKTLEDLNINKARKQTQKTGFENDLKRIEKDIAEQERFLLENQKEIEQTTQTMNQIKENILNLEKEKQELAQKESALTKELAEIEKEINSKNKNLTSHEQNLKSMMNKLLSVQSKLEHIQMRSAEINVEIKNVYSNFNEHYSRDLAEFESEMHEINTPAKEIRDSITDLKESLKNCGQVNLMAPEEFQEVKERYDFLTGQLDDLHKAQQDLSRITSEIRTESSDLFLKTYNQIRKNFHSMFRRLFGGGRAELRLTEPENVLESGIEIMAQPPGKNLESIALLSGGERSLTGVALLFATYMVRPSPFCILDEIDAALDEENVNRFINILAEFSKETQFIIITHNKKTITGTEALFGITMEESGVSKIITVRIKEPKKEETYA
ncbi:MAG: AAA family ATPase [Spirochaetales bacterium]|nr:AAA family ATPase [Spirochaetales bacterium]